MQDSHSAEGLLKQAVQLYRSSLLAVSVVDRDLRVVWANETAYEKFPSLRLPDGVRFMLPHCNIAGIVRHLEEGGIFTVSGNYVPLTTTVLTMTPILQAKHLCGAVVVFTLPEKVEGTALNPAGAERVVMTFNNQFRTPLSEIFSALSIATRTVESMTDSAGLTEYLDHINQNCYKMLRNVENISNYTKYNSAINEMKYERGDMARFLRSLCEALAVLIQAQGIGFSYDIPEAEVLAVFDSDKLAGAFLNIVSNSCRFTREGNSIFVSMENTEENVIITVSDRGMGIPEEILNRVFEAYFSYDPSGMPFAGAGLGLTNAKYAVTAHGGTTAIQSTAGHGTTIAFTLPRRDDESLPLVLHSTSLEYLVRKFSIVHKMMCDTCPNPTP